MSDFDEASEATEKPREAAEAIMEKAEIPGAGLLGVVNQGLAVNKGIGEIQKGDLANGVCDTGAGIAGVVAKGAGFVKEVAGEGSAAGAGAGTVGRVAGTVSGGITAGKGIGEIAKSDGWDDSKRWDGIHDVLSGGSDAVSGVAGDTTIGKAAGALGFGMKIGDAIAPTVFGDMKNTGTHYENADKEFHPSTGNNAVDWVFGVGDYTKGRW